MDENIEIRRFELSDIPALNEIRNKTFGFPLEESFWKWKYVNNPRKKNFSHVAVAEGRIVGHTGMLPVEMEHYGERFHSRQCADMMSDPDHHVKGAVALTYFTAINYPDEGITCPFLYGIGNTNAQGFSKHTSNSMMQGPNGPRVDRIVKINPFIRRTIGSRMISSLLGFPANLAIKAYHAFSSISKKNLAQVQEVTEFGPEYDELWARVGSEFPRTNVRSAAFLTWRYIEHPVHSYKTFAYSDQEGLKGFVVARIMEEKGIRRGLIVDLISGLKDPTVWEALLHEAINHLEGEGVELITCWMFDHMPYYETFEKLHFVSRPSDLSIQTFVLNSTMDLEFLNDPKNMYYAMGDSDIF